MNTLPTHLAFKVFRYLPLSILNEISTFENEYADLVNSNLFWKKRALMHLNIPERICKKIKNWRDVYEGICKLINRKFPDYLWGEFKYKFGKCPFIDCKCEKQGHFKLVFDSFSKTKGIRYYLIRLNCGEIIYFNVCQYCQKGSPVSFRTRRGNNVCYGCVQICQVCSEITSKCCKSIWTFNDCQIRSFGDICDYCMKICYTCIKGFHPDKIKKCTKCEGYVCNTCLCICYTLNQKKN